MLRKSADWYLNLILQHLNYCYYLNYYWIALVFFGWYASNSSFQNRIFWNQVVYVVNNNKLRYPSSLLHGELTDHYTRSEFSDFWNFVKIELEDLGWRMGYRQRSCLLYAKADPVPAHCRCARPCWKNFKGVFLQISTP